jgi:hypothetical protein
MAIEWGKIGGAIVTAAVLGGGAAYLTVRSELLNLSHEVRLLKEQHPHQYPAASASVSDFPKFSVVAFNEESCPEGWRAFESGRGRYIVGLTRGGNLGKVVGNELKNEENRSAGRHTHTFLDAPLGGSVDDGLGGGGYQRRRTERYSTDPNEAIEGTNAPYVQLLLCEKI